MTRTMEQLLSASLARQRFLWYLFGIFAAIALRLASIGIYGVLAYLTGQRVPEIGVRMALGATVRDVVRMVLRQCLRMVSVGLGVGIVAALAAGRAFAASRARNAARSHGDFRNRDSASAGGRACRGFCTRPSRQPGRSSQRPAPGIELFGAETYGRLLGGRATLPAAAFSGGLQGLPTILRARKLTHYPTFW
jgi:ABC-type antimicrobial peptide transport system permease subunit